MLIGWHYRPVRNQGKPQLRAKQGLRRLSLSRLWVTRSLRRELRFATECSNLREWLSRLWLGKNIWNSSMGSRLRLPWMIWLSTTSESVIHGPSHKSHNQSLDPSPVLLDKFFIGVVFWRRENWLLKVLRYSEYRIRYVITVVTRRSESQSVHVRGTLAFLEIPILLTSF